MRAVLGIAAVALRRMLRDRSNLFFVFILPLLLVLLIGMQFGGSFEPHLALHVDDGAGALADDLVEAVEAADVFVIDRVDDVDAVVDRVGRGAAAAGLTIPAGYDAALRDGATVEVGLIVSPSTTDQGVATTVRAAVSEQAATVRAARTVADASGVSFDEALARVQAVAADVPGVAVETSRLGESAFSDFEGLGQFDLGASSQLLLFVFLTSLAGSATLIQARQWGVSRRMLSTPTSARQIVLGEALGRFAVALVQAAYIVVGTRVIFGVDWGDPVGAAAVIVVFCLVSAGAAMLLGATFSNDAQAGGVGIGVGLGLAALGGSMAPIEVFSDTMQRVAHLVTPHAWANDAFAELVRRGGGVGDIVVELAVLLAVAAVLVTIASWRLHRVLVRP